MEGRMGLQTDPILWDHSLYCCRSNLYLLILQCKIGLLCFTLIQLPCFRRLIVIYLVYFVWIFENQAFNVSITQLTQSFLRLALNLKKQHRFRMIQLVNILQTSCFAPFHSSACPGTIPSILPHKFTRKQLMSSLSLYIQMSSIVKHQVRYLQ